MPAAPMRRDSDLGEAIAAARRCGSMRLAEWPATLAGFVEVSCGNYQAALDALGPLLSVAQSWPDASEIIAASFIPDAVEAMVQLGRLDEAEPLIDTWNATATDSTAPGCWPWACGAARCCKPRAATSARPHSTAQLALTQHERLPMPFERARTQLLMGQLQRRQRHRDAATPPCAKRKTPSNNSAPRSGPNAPAPNSPEESSGRRRAEGLTPSEQRVAELAVSGLTNRDIAATLFISPKTVEVNLSRIYRKLNIRSRVELYKALGTAKPESSSAPHQV